MVGFEHIFDNLTKLHPRGSELGWAFEVALTQHARQKDKAGEPYMLHLIRVCLRVHTDAEQVVALLHDVVEDGHLLMYHIRDYFDPYIADAIDAITKRDDEPYADYLDRVKANRVALAVKLADIADNSDERRLAKLDGVTSARLRKKYAAALKILNEN